jgi:hypothetical protein
VKRPLLVALAVSAGVHAAVLTVLLAARSQGRVAAPMRVRVLGARAEPSPASVESGPASTPPAVPERARPVVAPGSARRTAAATPAPPVATPAKAPPASGARTERAEATVPTTGAAPASPQAPRPEATPRPAVQDDIWVLTDDAPPEGAPASPSPGGSEGSGASPGPRGAFSPPPSSGMGGTGPPSLLGELNRRLAWSAARCTPPGAVRSSRSDAPEVPLHFCLDAAGRPSAVGLEGTTGSDLLDRAARECVVPGAAPLPPLPGCYTVAVRFPIRP